MSDIGDLTIGGPFDFAMNLTGYFVCFLADQVSRTLSFKMGCPINIFTGELQMNRVLIANSNNWEIGLITIGIIIIISIFLYVTIVSTEIDAPKKNNFPKEDED